MKHCRPEQSVDTTLTRRARGTVYLLVLSVSVLITGIGLSALMLTRVERRTTELTRAITEARLAASSLLEVIVVRINNDTKWRSTYTHDVWEPNETFDDMVFTFKLVDEEDGDLANDISQPVRLYCKVDTGGARRIYSVLLEPSQHINLLSNPGFEDGATDWQSWNCTLVPSGGAYSGSGCVFLNNRGTLDSTAWQDVTNVIENGKPYYVEAWAKSDFFSELVTISFKTTASSSGTRIFVTSHEDVATSWKKVSGFLTPTWSGTLSEARWRAFSYPAGSSLDFYIDDTVMIEEGELGMIPVPATWRREVGL